MTKFVPPEGVEPFGIWGLIWRSVAADMLVPIGAMVAAMVYWTVSGQVVEINQTKFAFFCAITCLSGAMNVFFCWRRSHAHWRWLLGLGERTDWSPWRGFVTAVILVWIGDQLFENTFPEFSTSIHLKYKK